MKEITMYESEDGEVFSTKYQVRIHEIELLFIAHYHDANRLYLYDSRFTVKSDYDVESIMKWLDENKAEIMDLFKNLEEARDE